MRLAGTILFFLIFCISICNGENSLQKKYPDKLLTNDYGILLKKDLIDKHDLLPLGPLGIDSNPAPRWLCFASINLKSRCTKSETKIEELNDYASDFEMTIDENGKQYEFYFRGLISYEGCEEHRTTWKMLLKGEEFFCISGALMGIDSKNENKISGAFNSLKTKNGCDSWFVGDCK